MYASDQLYTYDYNIDNVDKSWLYIIGKRDKWVMDVCKTYWSQYWFNNGKGIGCFGSTSKFSIFPVIYISSKSKIQSGDGSKDNPYEFKF